MVIITAIYDVATCFICFYNAKSASAAKKQIEEVQKQVADSQAQQRQNVGVQLYEKRKAVLKDFSEKKYNDVYWDIPILFDASINAEFHRICSLQNSLDTENEKIKSFEDHLKETQGNDVYDEYMRLSAQAEEHQDYSNLYDFCKRYAYTQISEIDGEIIKYNFEELNEKAIDLNRAKGALHFSTFLKMQDFIKASLSMEE